MISVKFRAFPAVNDPESCRRFILGHRKVLEAYGITMITSNNAYWMEHANTYVILAEDADGNAVGGVRVQIADDTHLPIEDAVGNVDKRIYEVVSKYKSSRTAEACGLWNAREVAGIGLSFSLLRAAIAQAGLLGVQTLFALAAPVTVNMCLNAGFVIERSLGKDGFFNYPKLDLVATAMFIDNIADMNNASDEDRSHIFEIRKNPSIVRMETGPKGTAIIEYKLLENACETENK
ncbi:hypothetical protein [Deminuibacter soli]|uniref:N-acetyltransferase domain-containing protein n=1 Tax=Deminuibacter soli TaxID=2291815 RepID=A0A3E1NDA1_9BACT|nr:hypothetical protein [Deminuibacter soli]RFM25842.1 hypothetical protein DXN05_23055 [Deminuibacter soli]